MYPGQMQHINEFQYLLNTLPTVEETIEQREQSREREITIANDDVMELQQLSIDVRAKNKALQKKSREEREDKLSTGFHHSNETLYGKPRVIDSRGSGVGYQDENPETGKRFIEDFKSKQTVLIDPGTKHKIGYLDEKGDPVYYSDDIAKKYGTSAQTFAKQGGILVTLDDGIKVEKSSDIFNLILIGIAIFLILPNAKKFLPTT